MSERSSRVVVPDTEAGYAKWIRQNQQGYVVNAPRSSMSNAKMMWHRADCGHIQPDGKLHFVEDDDMKACSLNAGELAAWACSRGRQMDYCDTCRTKWTGEKK